MAFAVYSLCALTALLCSVLLLRAYRRSRMRMLFWSGLCFAALALENVVLILDKFVVAEFDLRVIRLLIPLTGLAALLYGLLWESRSIR